MQTVSVGGLVNVHPDCRLDALQSLACSPKRSTPWIIGKSMARTASAVAFHMTLSGEVPTGRIDPLLIAHATEQAFGKG